MAHGSGGEWAEGELDALASARLLAPKLAARFAPEPPAEAPAGAEAAPALDLLQRPASTKSRRGKAGRTSEHAGAGGGGTPLASRQSQRVCGSVASSSSVVSSVS